MIIDSRLILKLFLAWIDTRRRYIVRLRVELPWMLVEWKTLRLSNLLNWLSLHGNALLTLLHIVTVEESLAIPLVLHLMMLSLILWLEIILGLLCYSLLLLLLLNNLIKLHLLLHNLLVHVHGHLLLLERSGILSLYL